MDINVIFFDFDGVLAGVADWPFYKNDNNKWPMRTIENNRIRYVDFMLGQHKQRAVFFPISSWSRHYSTTQKIQEFLDKMSLKNLIVPPTAEVYFDGQHRAEFVKNYVKKYDIMNYIVLDDEGTKSYREHKVKHIKTDVYDGLNHKTFMKLDMIFERWAKKK